MAEFSCEFCDAEFKDNSRLQRHIKTSKKCLSKRTQGPLKRTPTREEVRDPGSLVREPIVERTVQVDDLMTKYTRALKKIEEQKEELALKDGAISILKDKLSDGKRVVEKDVEYNVEMYCICGILRLLKDTNMKEVLDETIEDKYKISDNRYERDVSIAITIKK